MGSTKLLKKKMWHTFGEKWRIYDSGVDGILTFLDMKYLSGSLVKYSITLNTKAHCFFGERILENSHIEILRSS